METYTFTGHVDGGRLKVSLKALQRLRAAVQSWRRCPVTITIAKQRATRSDQANRFYWGVLVAAISEHTGYTPEETHECLKQLFLPKRVAMLDGNGAIHGELVIGGSTTKLDTVAFSEYCSRIREWAETTLGVEIPAEAA